MWLKSGIILFMCVNHILAFRTGAGTSACATMMPNHEGNVPQTTEPPYTISVSSNNVIQGEVLTVTIEDPSRIFQFRGFLIQARPSQASTEVIGTFFESPNARNVACVGNFPVDSVSTHRDSTLKSSITLRWQAPQNFRGTVQFLTGAGTSACATMMPNHEGNVPQTTEPPYTISVSSRNVIQGDVLTVTIEDPSGLLQFRGFIIQAITTISPRRADQSIIRLLQSRLENGRLYCRVERDSMTTVQGMQFDLVNDKHYLLLAMGTETTTNAIGTHGPWSEYSEEAVLLTQPRNLEPGGTRLLIMVHGSFMIVAWIGTASIGIFFASYFKKTWTNQTIFGKDVWFVCHTTCMMLTWLLTIASFIIIFVETGEWRTSVHAVTGTITTALVIIQPVGAVFRPKPESHNRPIFKLIHSAKGIFMYRLAIITLLFAVPLPAARLPSWTSFILVGFIVFYLKMNFFMTLIGTLGEMKRKKQPGSSKHAPYTILRKTILGFFIIVILLFVITLVLILAWPA
ncbi:CLUMA_CG008350, isoform A [Clunio marinus]|uniref:CLUMA_CG008350, isoform A n=1 Tax=Clunio marinus TaxID=568069 RepID=A0A1J1I522_9DIPT|nr:CLUMA_CG008350, isoform A [Clunio marinus]